MGRLEPGGCLDSLGLLEDASRIDIDKRDGASDVADYLRVRHLAVVSLVLRATTSWAKRTPGQYSPAHNRLGSPPRFGKCLFLCGPSLFL